MEKNTMISTSNKPRHDDGSKQQQEQTRSLWELILLFLNDWDNNLWFLLLLLLMETLLCTLILKFVSYTEIDWKAYMQEVTMWWRDGERNYRNIYGDTGPLVYPAGFLYLYLALQQVTDQGSDILKAQVCFAFFYVVTTGLVLGLYHQVMTRTTTTTRGSRSTITLLWTWQLAMVFLCASKRLHSIFVLRLFNDGPAMMLLFVAMHCFTRNKCKWGCVWYSAAVSIKMNILLFAPGLLLLLLEALSVQETIVCLSICAAVQLVLGTPFLLTYPTSYLRKAFELDRVFEYTWTVNWKFLSEELFVSKPLSLVLLGLHLFCLACLAFKWKRRRPGKPQEEQQNGAKPIKPRQQQQLAPEYVLYTLWVSNFVGIVFARTLHYQFYVWYYHSVPMMILTSCKTRHPIYIIVGLVGCMVGLEYAFHVYPATPTSSALLQVVHCLVLVHIFAGPVPQKTTREPGRQLKKE